MNSFSEIGHATNTVLSLRLDRHTAHLAKILSTGRKLHNEDSFTELAQMVADIQYTLFC